MSGRDATQWALKKIAMPIVLSLGLLLALGYADATMNVELDLFLIYYMPVAIMAWCVGRGPGLLTALLGAGVWSWADVASGHTYSSEFFQYYNWALGGPCCSSSRTRSPASKPIWTARSD
jgi:hypothetical protein